jgi:hypothetical protein
LVHLSVKFGQFDVIDVMLEHTQTEERYLPVFREGGVQLLIFYILGAPWINFFHILIVINDLLSQIFLYNLKENFIFP